MVFDSVRKLITRFRIILSHPTTKGRRLSTIWRAASWLLAWKVLGQRKLVFPYLENSELVAATGTIGCAGAYICSMYEFEDMAFLLHFLREEDLVFDIGANIGWYTVLAASERNCKVVSFEPIDSAFSFLKLNVALNGIEEQVSLHRKGVGSAAGMMAFISDRDVENRVATATDASAVQIEMTTVDAVAVDQCPTVLKIDVEGFEASVLQGATSVLHNSTLKVLLVELVGHGQRYGFDERAVRRNLEDLGFSPVSYEPSSREFHAKHDELSQNTLFIRDLEFVQTRVTSAEPIRLFGPRS